VVSIVLGAVFLAFALAVYHHREGRLADYAARRLFAFSIFYLFGLFAMLLLERGIDRLVD
jgi:protoheme IX farnesyltransferase